MISIINQVFEIQKKSREQKIDVFNRNLERLYFELEEMGYEIVDPIGEHYDDRDTSIEVNLVGNSTVATITKVLKPVIYFNESGKRTLIQKGIVIAE